MESQTCGKSISRNQMIVLTDLGSAFAPGDLFSSLWNHDKLECKFVEVKGPGDSLSETQKVWIDVLLSCVNSEDTTSNVQVELCHVMTHEDKDEYDLKQLEKKKNGSTGGYSKSLTRKKRSKSNAAGGGGSDSEDEK